MCVHYGLMVQKAMNVIKNDNRAVIGQSIYSFLTFFTGLL